MRMGGGAAGAMEMPFTVEFKKPNMIRLEFTMQGMTAVQAFDGEIGWAILPFLGKTEAEEMAEDQVKQLKDQADFEGVLVNYKEKGHTVELVGQEEVDGTPAYKLKVTRADGDVDYLYLDEEYFVEFKIEATREVQGNEVTISTVLGDYKEVDGLLFAHSMEMAFGGGEAQQVITIETIELGDRNPRRAVRHAGEGGGTGRRIGSHRSSAIGRKKMKVGGGPPSFFYRGSVCARAGFVRNFARPTNARTTISPRSPFTHRAMRREVSGEADYLSCFSSRSCLSSSFHCFSKAWASSLVMIFIGTLTMLSAKWTSKL